MISARYIIRTVLFAFLFMGAGSLYAQGFLIPTVRTDMVFDHAGHHLYIADGDGLIKTFNLSTRTFGRTYNLGGWVWGIDIARDDSFIVAAQAGVSGSQGTFQRVNLATGAITNIHYTRADGETGGWDVAIASNGLAMVTTQFAGSGWTPLRQIDLNTNSITIRSDAPGSGAGGQVRLRTEIHRSADGTRLLFMEQDSSAGPFFTYSALTNSFGQAFGTNRFLDNTAGAVSPNGNLVALSTYSNSGWPAWLETAPDFGLVHTLNQILSGVAFDAVRDILYGVNSISDEIVAYSTVNFAELFRLPVGEAIGSPPFTTFDTGTLVASADGRWLALETNSGIRLFQLPAPAFATNPATNVASYSAVLNGSLDPHGLATTVYFQYGPTNSYGFTTPVQTQAGSTFRNVSANASGLSAGTTYHFRIVTTSASGTRYGGDRTFTTLGLTGPPIVTTEPAVNVRNYSVSLAAATLAGSLDPHGLTTTVYFQYGPTTSYGFTTPAHTQTGNTFRNFNTYISGLMSGTAYHFRIVATNSAGTRYGEDKTFATIYDVAPPPNIATTPATFIASFSATLNGLLQPSIFATAVHFEYGPTTSYGFTTRVQTLTGNTLRHVSANISGLMAGTTYHFRILATNLDGTTRTTDATFRTLSATGPPVAITSPASGVTSSAATLHGSLDPHGLTTNVYFQYGTTTSYGNTTAMQTKTGNIYQSVNANISGLTAGTTYHFRTVGTNSAGTVYGGDRIFTTP
jgi:hypothetical protein